MNTSLTQQVIFDFSTPEALRAWRSIDDGVMGGRSRSQIMAGPEGSAIFAGIVSLENNGGFASVRSGAGRWDLAGFDGIILRVRGDGKRYGFNIRLSELFLPLRYELTFDTEPDRWQRVTLPFEAMRAMAFGTPLPLAPDLNPRRIRSFGFIIADAQAGPFRLEISAISAYREGGA